MLITNALSAYTGAIRPATPRPAASPAAAPADAPQRASLPASEAVQKALADTPVVDQEKVDKIKAAIASGSFSINPEKIAAGLLKAAQERISTQA